MHIGFFLAINQPIAGSLAFPLLVTSSPATVSSQVSTLGQALFSYPSNNRFEQRPIIVT